MRYSGMVIRPPSEAESLILQVTYGCSHNKCSFCPTYLDKPFRLRAFDDVKHDINEAKRILPDTRRVFLADGNAMVMNAGAIMAILEALNDALPNLQRVGIYANAADILGKSDGELGEMYENRLSIIYMGLESGDNSVLKRANKGATAEQIIEAVLKAQAAGMKVSVIALLGLGGTSLWQEHAVATGKAISIMSPRFFSLLTLMIVPGTKLHEERTGGDFCLPGPLDMLGEMRLILEHTNVSAGCIFRSNHASNYLPLAGTLPKDKNKLISTIDQFVTKGGSGLRPEWSRGL